MDTFGCYLWSIVAAVAVWVIAVIYALTLFAATVKGFEWWDFGRTHKETIYALLCFAYIGAPCVVVLMLLIDTFTKLFGCGG
ncbi:MAG: hypothetical protein ACXADS_16625 [Candidatus Thorarchaeota archaeon]|jgi:hypothetical protein